MKIKIIAVLIAISAIVSACTKAEPFEWNKEYDLSVMSFNLRYDTSEDGKNQWSNRKEACISMLKKTKPSILGIQEGLHHQVTYLDENLPDYNYIGVGRDYGDEAGEYNAVYYLKSKFELLESNTFWLSETPDEPSKGWDGDCKRIVTWAKLKDKDTEKEIYIFNTHLDHVGEKAQKEGVKLLVKKIDEIVDEKRPIFITGDFNILSRDEALDPILGRYYSARRFAQYTDNIDSFNFFGNWPLSWNLDYIFYTQADALAFRTVAEDFGVPYISDHYPIITHFNY
jgi:endonuclease/exonuclease/phosphatase family metal-dependent hydrolase